MAIDISIVKDQPEVGKATVCAENAKACEWIMMNVYLGHFDGRCVIIEDRQVPSFTLELDKVKLTYKYS